MFTKHTTNNRPDSEDYTFPSNKATIVPGDVILWGNQWWFCSGCVNTIIPMNEL